MTTEIKNKIDSATENLNCSWEQGEKKALKQLDTSLSNLRSQSDIHKENIQYLWCQIIESKGKTVDEFLQKDVKEQLLPSKQKLDALTKTMETLSPEAQREAVRKFIREEIWAKLTVLCTNRDDVVAALQVYVNGINDLNGKHAQIPYDATRVYSEYSTGTEKRLFIDGILGPHTYKALWLALFGQDLDKIYIRKSSAIDDKWVAKFSWSSDVIKNDAWEYVKNGKEYNPGLESIKSKEAVWFVGADGMVYLPGPDGLWKPYSDPNDKYSMKDANEKDINNPENMPLHYQKMNLFLNFYEIWKQQALDIAGSLTWLNSSWNKDETQIIRSKIAAIDKSLQSQIRQINTNNDPKKVLSLNFDTLFKAIGEVESQEDIFGQDDVDSIKTSITHLKTGKYKESELNIITKSRKKFGDALLDTFGLAWGWNSEWAKWWLIESRILDRPDFKNINTLIASPEVMDQIKSANEAGLTQSLRNCSILHKNALPLAKKMIKQYASIEQKTTKNKSQLRQQIADVAKVNGVINVSKQKEIMNLWNQQNIGLKVTNWDQYLNQATDLAVKSSIEMASMMYLRDLAVEAKLTQKYLAGTAEDPELKQLKSILWIGAGISDKTAEWAAEIASTVALSAVTMWAGMALAKWALSAARRAAKATRIASLVSKIEKAAVTGGRVAKWWNKLTKFGVNLSKITIEWVAFYEGSNTMTNLLTKNTDLFENILDWKEIGKSVAFMGALKVMWKYLGKFGEKIPAPTAKIPLKFFNGGKWVTAALLEGAGLVWISQWIEFAFGWEFHPTVEEFIQAMILSRIAYKAGKLAKGEYVFRKRKGVIVMEKALPEHKQPKQLLEKNPAHPDDIVKPLNKSKTPVKEPTAEVKEIGKMDDLNIVRGKYEQIEKDIVTLEKTRSDMVNNPNFSIEAKRTSLKAMNEKLTQLHYKKWVYEAKLTELSSKSSPAEVKEVGKMDNLRKEKARLSNEYYELYDKFNKSRNQPERNKINKDMIEKTRKMNEIDTELKILQKAEEIELINQNNNLKISQSPKGSEYLELNKEYLLQKNRVESLSSELKSDRLNGNELNRTTKESELKKMTDTMNILFNDVQKLKLEIGIL